MTVGPGRKNEPDCFQLISKKDLDGLSRHSTQLTYSRGETIFKQNALAPHVLFIQSGLIKVYLEPGNNRHMNLWLAQSGDFLAFSTMFGEKVYSYSASALKDSDLLMIEKENLRELLRNNPEFALRITSKNFGTEKHLTGILTSMSGRQMRGKLANSLLYLHNEVIKTEDIFSLLSRQEIADFAAISVESVIKFLKEFEQDGILKLDGKNIQITDIQKLLIIGKNG